MIRRAYWSGLAAILLALAFATGCNNRTAGGPPVSLTVVTAMSPFAQSSTINNPTVATPVAFASPFQAMVTTTATPGAIGTPVAGVIVTFTVVPALGTGAAGTFGYPSGNPSVTATTDANGVATSGTSFFANGSVGTYIVIASANSTASTAPFLMSNTLVPQTTTVAAGTPQSASIGLEFATQLAVTVKDINGIAVSGIPVTFAAPASGTSGYFIDSDTNTTVAVTNSNGLATAAIFVAGVAGSMPGTYTVSATPQGAALGDVANFTLSNTTTPMTITASAGSGQSATVNDAYANPLVALVVDKNGDPVQYAVVTFSAPGQPAAPAAAVPSGTFADSGTITTTATTDVNGLATAAAFTANGTAGAFTVSASVSVANGTTLTTATPFALTNTP